MHLVERKHHERAAAAGVDNHGHKLGVDRAEVAVTSHLGYADVIVAVVGLGRLAKDVAEFAAAHHLPGHGGDLVGINQKNKK